MALKESDTLARHPSLLLLQRTFEGLHVGGKSALGWYGVRQPLQEARELVESAYSLRADVLTIGRYGAAGVTR